MSHLRTFFLVQTAFPPHIGDRFTCPDIRQQLVVEQVDARLTGQPLTIDNLVTAYPQAVRATHHWEAMKTAARKDNTVRGPFIVVTEGDVEPSDDDLLKWYATQRGAAITADTTGFLAPIIGVLAEIALGSPPSKKRRGR